MRKVRQFMLAAFVLSAAANGLADTRPLDTYKSIIDRNPFGLKDPPPPKETNAPPPPQAKKEDFYLTGISSIGNPKKPKAYLLAKDQSKKEYVEKYYNLSLGDRQGDVTLIEVDTKGRRVKIGYLGEEKWLSMKDNGVPAPMGGPAMNPGVPGAPGMGMPMQGGNPPPPNAVPIPLPNANPNAMPGQQPAQPIYPNAGNITRRPMRSAQTAATFTPGINPGTMGAGMMPGMTTAQPNQPSTAYTGPQTDAEMLKHIIEVQNPEKFNPNLPKGIPPPPMPPMPGLPGM